MALSTISFLSKPKSNCVLDFNFGSLDAIPRAQDIERTLQKNGCHIKYKCSVLSF